MNKKQVKFIRQAAAILILLVVCATGIFSPARAARAQSIDQPENQLEAQTSVSDASGRKFITYIPLLSNPSMLENQPLSGVVIPPTAADPAPSTADPAPTGLDPSGSSRILWGAYIDGKQYGRGSPPWDMGTLDLFETNAGKKVSILHYGLPWSAPAPCWPGNTGGSSYHPFQPSLMDTLRSRGSIPMLDWSPWSKCGSNLNELEKFTLSAITSGLHDAYIRQWATDAKAWGHPFMLRIGWEMNGGWFPWGEQAEGNNAGEFVPMWRHVHDIFNEVGADNVSWIWCPNVDYAEGTPIDELYPGDAYVDWTCMDGYNKGFSGNDNGKWKSFYQVFKKTYDQLLAIAPDKPVMIGETSSIETGGSKADWITDTLTTQLPVNFPQVKALVWFNWNVDDAWGIESSASALSAFSSGIASPYYAANEFGALDLSPILSPP